jgi:hypothetical protein
VIDEKQNTVELTEKGINLISDSGDPNFYVIPDIGSEIAQLEKEQLSTEELVDRKAIIQADSFLSKLPSAYQVIHYRRGDFVGHPNKFGTLAPKYYEQNLLPDFPVIILTDSYSSALDDFKHLTGVVVANPEEVDPWIALKIMSQSQFVIGSNSTLSWWGCYLATQNGGSAIIPKPFYLNNMNQSLYYPGFKSVDAVFSETLNH